MSNLIEKFIPGDQYLSNGIFFDPEKLMFKLYHNSPLQVSVSINDPNILQKILKCWVLYEIIMKGTHTNSNDFIDYTRLEQVVQSFLAIDRPRLIVRDGQLLILSDSCCYVHIDTYLAISLKYFN